MPSHRMGEPGEQKWPASSQMFQWLPVELGVHSALKLCWHSPCLPPASPPPLPSVFLPLRLLSATCWAYWAFARAYHLCLASSPILQALEAFPDAPQGQVTLSAAHLGFSATPKCASSRHTENTGLFYNTGSSVAGTTLSCSQLFLQRPASSSLPSPPSPLLSSCGGSLFFAQLPRTWRFRATVSKHLISI